MNDIDTLNKIKLVAQNRCDSFQLKICKCTNEKLIKCIEKYGISDIDSEYLNEVD
jgi:hypothetical protein